MKQILPIMVIVVVQALLSGCKTENSQANVTSTPSNEAALIPSVPEPTVLPVATASSALSEPTLEPMPTRSELPPGPTPSLPDSFSFEAFLFEENPCELPCWQGLVIGQSSTDDVQQVADSILGLNGFVNLFEPGPYVASGSIIPLPNNGPPANRYMIGYDWDNQGLFSFAAFFDPTDTLTGLMFDLMDFREYPRPSLQKVLDELGVPDYWMIQYDSSSTLSPIPDEHRSFMPWDLVYAEGIFICMDIPGPLTLAAADGDSNRAAITICEQAEAIKATALLTTPYQDIHDRSPDQIFPDYAPELLLDDREVEAAFGLSKQEVMNSFLSSQDVCLTTK